MLKDAAEFLNDYLLVIYAADDSVKAWVIFCKSSVMWLSDSPEEL